MAKKSPASSRREGLTTMTSEDIKNRKWTETERRLVQRHAAKQAAGDDSEINYDDIPRFTDEQLAQMVRLRDVRPEGAGQCEARSKCTCVVEIEG